MSRHISLLALLGIIAIIGLLFYRVMIGFFVPLFLAATLVVVFRPLHRAILQRIPRRQHLAALLTTASILLIVLVPASAILAIAAVQGTALISDFNVNSLDLVLKQTRRRFGMELPEADLLHRMDREIARLSAETTPTEARKIAARLLPMVDEMEEATPESQADVAAQPIARLRELLKEIEEFGPPDSARIPPTAPPPPGSASQVVVEPLAEPEDSELGYITLVTNVGERYRTAKVAVLGGPLWASLTQLVNPESEQLRTLADSLLAWIQPRLLRITSATGEFLIKLLIGVVVLVIATYFFLLDSEKIIHTVMKLSPLDDRYEDALLTEFNRVSRAVVLATILSALAQGVLAAIGYSIAGLNSVVLLSLLTGVMAMVPFLGAASIWVPASLWLVFVVDRPLAGILLAIYGAVIVSSVDNLIKAFVLHGQSQLHPLLALLSVLGGVQVFGPIGILVGPMVVVFLQTLLEILNRELTEGHIIDELEPYSAAPAPDTLIYRTATGKPKGGRNS